MLKTSLIIEYFIGHQQHHCHIHFIYSKSDLDFRHQTSYLRAWFFEKTSWFAIFDLELILCTTINTFNIFPVVDSFDSFYKLATAIARNWQLLYSFWQQKMVVSSTARVTLVQESPVQWLEQGPRIILQNHQTNTCSAFIKSMIHTS